MENTTRLDVQTMRGQVLYHAAHLACMHMTPSYCIFLTLPPFSPLHRMPSTVWCSRSVQLCLSTQLWQLDWPYNMSVELDHDQDCGVFYAADTRQNIFSAAAILFAGLLAMVSCFRIAFGVWIACAIRLSMILLQTATSTCSWVARTAEVDHKQTGCKLGCATQWKCSDTPHPEAVQGSTTFNYSKWCLQLQKGDTKNEKGWSSQLFLSLYTILLSPDRHSPACPFISACTCVLFPTFQKYPWWQRWPHRMLYTQQPQ